MPEASTSSSSPLAAVAQSSTGPASTPTTEAEAKINGHHVHVELDSIEDALQAIAAGEVVVVVDDMDRENEGDLIMAAALCTTEKMAWIVRHSSGYICVTVPPERLDELEIPLMIENNTEKHKTAYTHTIDYKPGVTTGISAHDRALTARKLTDTTVKPDEFNRPGHLVPLRARAGGVLERRGHTESACDLVRLAGVPGPPVGVICELLKPDDPEGGMARRDDCFAFAKQWKCKMISIEQLADYRQQHRV